MYCVTLSCVFKENKNNKNVSLFVAVRQINDQSAVYSSS